MSVLAFVRRPLITHVYSHRCSCAVCRVIHQDRVDQMRQAILACRRQIESAK